MDKVTEIKTHTYNLKTNCDKLPLDKLRKIITIKFYWRRDLKSDLVIKTEESLSDEIQKKVMITLLCKHSWRKGEVVDPVEQDYKDSTPLRWMVCEKCENSIKTLYSEDMREWYKNK